MKDMNMLVELKIKTLESFDIANINVIEPKTNRDALEGFSYPSIDSLFGDLKDMDVFVLRELERLGLIIGEHCDRVLVCPFCYAYNICFRDSCPKCRSSQVTVTQMVHHYRCGYVGEEREFNVSNNELVCPKCSYKLLHVGKDYEKSSEVYRCEDCDWSGSETVTMGLCVACDKEVEPEKCIVRDIKKYRLSPNGRAALQTGEAAKILDSQHALNMGTPARHATEIAHADDFVEKLASIAFRRGKIFMAAVFICDELMKMDRREQRHIAKSFTEAIADRIRSVANDSGHVMRLDDVSLCMAIIGEDKGHALETISNVIEETAKTKFSGSIPSTTLSTGIKLFRRSDDFNSLLLEARELAREAFRQGGNRIVQDV